jgi:hypothetical protein
VTAQPIPITRKTDDLVAELVDIVERVEALKEREAAIRAELAKLPIGTHHSAAGSFAVRGASRKFDADRAYASLPEAAQALCLGVVPGLVKAQIPPAALDAFMVESPNGPTVVLK